VAIGIDIGHAHSPGPESFGASLIRYFGEMTLALVQKEGVAEDIVGSALQNGVCPFRRTPCFTLPPFKGAAQVGRGSSHFALGHVRVHVRDEQIRPSVLVEIEEFDTHRAPRSLWEHAGGFIDKPLSLLVLVIVVVALHIQHVQVWKAVLIQVGTGRVATPTPIVQSHLSRYILEFLPSEILVENFALRPVGVQMAPEGVRNSDEVSAGALLVRSVAAHIRNKQVQQAIPVEIEEDDAGGMTDMPHAGLLGNVLEASLAQVFEEHVSESDGGDEKVRVAVVVNVRESRGYAHAILQTDGGGGGDVLKSPVAKVAPECVAAELVGEVDVKPPVSIDVRDGDPRPVIVVHRLEVFVAVGDGAVQELNSALRTAIREAKIIERAELS